MSALLKCNVLQQYLLEARVMSCSSNSCYKVLQGLTRMRARKSEQFIQLLRMNLVTGIVLYCKVLVSCRGPTYVTICKWYFKLNTLKTLLTYILNSIEQFELRRRQYTAFRFRMQQNTATLERKRKIITVWVCIDGTLSVWK